MRLLAAALLSAAIAIGLFHFAFGTLGLAAFALPPVLPSVLLSRRSGWPRAYLAVAAAAWFGAALATALASVTLYADDEDTDLLVRGLSHFGAVGLFGVLGLVAGAPIAWALTRSRFAPN